MTVSFLGAISEITGTREQRVSASSVRDLMEAMLQTYTDPWRQRVFDGQELTPDVVIMVNGMNVHRMEGLSTRLNSGDRVDILPMFEGG